MEKLLFSTDTDSGTITVLSVSDDGISTIAVLNVGNGPRGAVRFTKDGRGFVSNHAGNTISEIDAYSLSEVGRIEVGIAPIGVAIVPGDKFAIVSNGGSNTVSVVDLASRKEVHSVAVGREPRHPDISPDGKTAYIPISSGHHVSILDLSELVTEEKPNFSNVREVGRVFLGAGTFPYSAAASPDGNWIIAANNQKDFVSLIDAESLEVHTEIDLGDKGARGTAYSPDGQYAFVSIEDISKIAVISLDSKTVIQKLDTAAGPRGLLYDSDDNTIYVSGFERTAKPERRGNVVSVIKLPDDNAKSLADYKEPLPLDAPVGAGPCSVSMFRR